MSGDAMIKHTLPGEGGEESWFSRLNGFEQRETKRQVIFKRTVLSEMQDGVWSKNTRHSYPHIMPDADLRKVLYDPIAQAVLDYCSSEDIAIHTEALNLRSSQICCFNFLYPLRADLSQAHRILAAVLPGAIRVTRIEFEYTGDAGTVSWLGEPPGGKRGQNRTSIDAAIWWEDSSRRYLTLCEWKYTERGFGKCGGYESDGNRNKDYCTSQPASGYATNQGGCYLTSLGRHYWEHLSTAGIDISRLAGVSGCPFRGSFYQPLRQFLLAAYLRAHSGLDDMQGVDEVEVALIHFRDNASLSVPPANMTCLGHGNVVDAWNALLSAVPPLRSAYAEDIAAELRRSHDQGHQELAHYLRSRYGA